MNLIKRTIMTAGLIGIISTPFAAIDAYAKEQLNPKLLTVPADPDGTYIVVQKAKKNGMAIIQMIRKGTFGTTYTSRLINCQESTFKYLATEDDAEVFVEKHKKAMEALYANDMKPLIHASVSDYVATEACK